MNRILLTLAVSVARVAGSARARSAGPGEVTDTSLRKMNAV